MMEGILVTKAMEVKGMTVHFGRIHHQKHPITPKPLSPSSAKPLSAVERPEVHVQQPKPLDVSR